MKAYFVDVFTATPGQGNPAAVVLGAFPEAEMANAAITIGLETTFVDGTTLHYYQPSGARMTICGHGTLAALAVLGREGKFSVTAPAGELRVAVEPHRIGFTMPQVTLSGEMDSEVAAVGLDIDPGDIDGPVLLGSAGRPKLIVPLRSLAALDALKPSQASVDACCKQVGATGVYAFTRQDRGFGAQADARHFCYGAGFYEDPATGNAAVALARYLWQHSVMPGCACVRIAQGHAMGRPSLILVKQEPDGQTWIYGQAAIGGTREL